MIEPYYQHAGITIYLGDCREILSQLEPVGFILTDPPYGCEATTKRGGVYDGFKISGDTNPDLRDWIVQNMSCPMIIFGSPKIRRPDCKATLIWAKGDHTGMGDLSFPWKPDFEEIYIIGEGFKGPRTSSVLHFNARIDSNRFHPTEKPIGLIKNLIEKCPPGIILDPFMGSGTTLVAAKELGRQAIGIEIEEKYIQIAIDRLRQEVLPFGG